MKKILILTIVLMFCVSAGATTGKGKDVYTTGATDYWLEPFYVIDEDGKFMESLFDSVVINQCNLDSCRRTVLSTDDTYDVDGTDTDMYWTKAAQLKASMGNTAGHYVWWIKVWNDGGVTHTPFAGTYEVIDTTTPTPTNAIQISGDADAADTLEKILDGGITTIHEHLVDIENDSTDISALALEASLLTENSNIGIDLDDITGTLDDGEVATIGVNTIQISGDGGAADTLEKILDGDITTIHEHVVDIEDDSTDISALALEASLLTEDSNIGIDLDDVTGTLSNAEIEDDVDINVKTVTADAISPTDYHQDWWDAWRDSIPEFWAEADTGDGNDVAETWGRILSTPAYVQGSGTDASPSEWDATDWEEFQDSIFYHYIFADDYSEDLANDSIMFALAAYFAGDTLGWATLDSIHTAIADANKSNFHSSLSESDIWTWSGGNRTLSGAQTFNLTGNIYGSVTSVTGNVGGNVTGTIGGIVADGITETDYHQTYWDAVRDSAGEFIWEFATRILTALDEDNTTMDLDGTTIGTVTTLTNKTGFSLASTGLNGVSQASGYVLSRPDFDNITGTLGSSEIDSAGFGLRVWSYDVSALTGNTAGGKLNSAASAGDPWSTNLPGSYTSNQAGFILGSYLDDDVSDVRTDIAALNNITSANVYTEFTAGSNEDVFKATVAALALEATVAALNDLSSSDIYDAVKQYFDLDSATADTGDGSIIHKIISDAAGGGSGDSKEDIYNHFIDGSNEDAFKSDGDTNQVNVAVGPDDWTAGDSAAYQGEASGLTAAGVADAVTDSLGLGLGAGDYSCTLVVLNSNDTTAIQSAWITTYSSDYGTKYSRTDTDVNGKLIFKLDAEDSVIFEASKPGVSFTVPEYISITEAQTDTIWGDVLTPSAATGDMVALQFYQLTPGYDSLSATEVEYRLVQQDASDTTEYDEYDQDDLLTFGTGGSTITLSKSWQTETAQADSSYVTFDVFSNWDIYVNGVQDSSSYFEFIIKWLDGDETRIISKIDSTSTQNPSAP
jgi:hypothetical protein